MKFKIIKTTDEYNKAIDLLEELGDREDFQDNEELIEQFELLSTLINLYEKQHFPIKTGHPIEIIQLKMDYLGLKRKDLIPLIGSSGVISEVFNKKRELSKKMIRNFSQLLDLDQNILNPKYELETTPPTLVKKEIKKEKITEAFKFIKSKEARISRFRNQIRQNRIIFNINTHCAI